jgi:outer membrane protein OmpA-like peptidoglycan-associated protein
MDWPGILSNTARFTHLVLVAAALAAGLLRPLAADEPVDLVATGEGGHLLAFASQYDDSEWAAVNLIDGTADRGWAGQSAGPQAVVIGFRDDALAEIDDILINPYSKENTANWAKEVEIQLSATFPFGDFTSLGRFTLAPEGRLQALPLPAPIRARYVKVIFLANRGGGYMEAGEVQVMGHLVPGAAAAPRFEELAAAAAGGRIERATSQYDAAGWAAANLLAPDGRGQWAATSGAAQEVVVALPRAAQVAAVAINNYAREDPANWAASAAVEVSATSPYEAFRAVGALAMPAVGDLHTLTIYPPVTAGWVKVVFRANRGGGYMEAARIRVFEAAAVAPAAPANIARELEETGRAVPREIHFSFNSAEILADSQPALAQIARILRVHPALKLRIEGHTDSVGGAEFNLDLSRRRADAVKRWLVDREGINEVRLTIVGYGLTRPVASNETEEGRALNRRVELVKK